MNGISWEAIVAIAVPAVGVAVAFGGLFARVKALEISVTALHQEIAALRTLLEAVLAGQRTTAGRLS